MVNKVKKDRRNFTYKLLIIIATVTLVFNFLPQVTSFHYKYEIDSVWDYPTLESPISFPIQKSQEQLTKEILEIGSNIKPFYIYNEKQTEEKINGFRKSIYSLSHDSASYAFIQRIDSIYSNLMYNGIIKKDKYTSDKDSSFIICLQRDKYGEYRFLGDFNTIVHAYNVINNEIRNNNTNINNRNLEAIVNRYICENVVPDEEKTEALRQSKLNSISTSQGLLEKGEIIVHENQIITEDIYNNINSLKYYYETSRTDDTSIARRISTYIFFIFIIVCFLTILYIYYPDAILNTRKFIIICTTLFITMCIMLISENFAYEYAYIIPLCIIPIVLRAFFDHRVAFWGLIFSALLISTTIPNGFQYAIDNILTGTIVIAFLSKLEKRSQYFLIVFIVLISYISLTIIHTFIDVGELRKIDSSMITYHFLNALLSLTALPLVFYIEKITGVTTDISLIEYSNTNNKVLRELANMAPGTFQHSIQVANLAENAARKIGANVLLTRVGALYHDIGKTANPYYFTENQGKAGNPHAQLTPRESAQILLDHITNGVEIANKNLLPESIKDFIRTHHGTRLASFFYTKAVEQEGAENVNEDDFRYKGPKPFSRETAIIMMADSVEAVSKTLTTFDEETISKIVNSVIDKQISENQFDNTNLTFKEIEIIKKVFISRLKTSFHLRIKYPS